MSLKYFLKEERRAKSHFRVTIKGGNLIWQVKEVYHQERLYLNKIFL